MDLEPRTALARASGAALFLAAIALFVLFQELGAWLRREEQRAWWPGTGRDLLNGAGFAAIAASLSLYGFPIAPALVVAGTLTLLVFGTSLWLERGTRRRRALALAAAAAFALPVVIFPVQVIGAVAALVARLFAR